MEKKEIKLRAFYNKHDSVEQLIEFGGIYVVHNDTIKTHSYGAYGSSPLFSGDYPITGGVLSINHKEKSIEQVKFGIYPKTVAQNIAWGQNPERRKFKGYPVTFPDSLPPLPLSQWPPFRRWKARLDSINAGLRPPEKSR